LTGKRVDDLTDLTVQGIWEAHLQGELAEADAVDRAAINAAGVLAEKGHWKSPAKAGFRITDRRGSANSALTAF
jgi:hypothetical protein